MHGCMVRNGNILSSELVAMRQFRPVYWTDCCTLTGWTATGLGLDIPDRQTINQISK